MKKSVVWTWIMGAVLMGGGATEAHAQDDSHSTLHHVGVALDRAAITAQVKTALMADGRTKAFDTNVDTDDHGEVTLTGTAPSEESKQAAGEVTGHVAGVTRVTNRLVVTPDRTSHPQTLSAQTETVADNGWLTAKIKAALADDDRVSMFDIHVKSDHGEVTLSGTVPTETARLAAVDRTRQVEGVTHVDYGGLQVVSQP